MCKKKLSKIIGKWIKPPKFHEGVVFFITGLLLVVLIYISLRIYGSNSHQNFLPPAGHFIEADSEFSFAVMGDSGMRNSPMDAVVSDIKNHNVDFILDIGDQARHLSAQHFEWIVDELRDELGDTPFYAVPGNHDITRQKDQSRFRFYKRAFGQTYYWFGYGNTLFVGLNSSTETMDPEQLLWLEKIMQKLRASFQYCIFYTHVPPKNPKTSCFTYGERADESLKRIVAEYDVTAIISGHLHEYLEDVYAGTPLYVIPPSGQEKRGKTRRYGYFLCKISPEFGLQIVCNSVDSSENREYLETFFSTELYKIPAFTTGILLVIGGAWIIYYRKKH